MNGENPFATSRKEGAKLKHCFSESASNALASRKISLEEYK